MSEAKPLPADFAVSDQLKAWAAKHCPLVDVEEATRAFIDWATKVEATFVNPSATWMRFMHRRQAWAVEAKERKIKVTLADVERILRRLT
jgi:hypothetical protein